MVVFAFPVLMAGSAGAAPKASTSIPKDARCAVCGMFVARFPAWVSSVTLKGGTKAYFDGPKDLFTYYVNPAAYGGGKRSDITAVTVKGYYSLKPIDGRKAYFVTGSDAMGPMGPELVPFERKADAMGFRKDHKGKKVLRFSEITPAVLKALE